MAGIHDETSASGIEKHRDNRRDYCSSCLASIKSLLKSKREVRVAPPLYERNLASIGTECVGIFSVNYSVDSSNLVFSLHSETNRLFDNETDD